MNKNEKLAQEAAAEIGNATGCSTAEWEEAITPFIHAAIEKATEEAVQNAYNDGWVAGRDALRVAIAKSHEPAAQPQRIDIEKGDPRKGFIVAGAASSEPDFRDTPLENSTNRFEPEPTSEQEWTQEYAKSLIKGNSDEIAALNVKNAHNAALAAEREKVDRLWASLGISDSERAKYGPIWEVVSDIRQQLATEQEKAEQLEAWKQSALSVRLPMQEIGKELGLTLGDSIHDKILPAIKTIKPLVEALEELVAESLDGPASASAIKNAQDLLAKVKERK